MKKKKLSEKDFDLIIRELFEKHENLFFAEINKELFICEPLNRKSYKNIVINNSLNQIEKEDEVCKECVLWPFEFNPDEYEAGLPSELYAKIMEASFLTSIDDMITLIQISNQEMDQLDMQMACIISEAFPNYSMDEIESWDMIKFCRMYSKSEWKLKNLRTWNFDNDMLDILQSIASPSEENNTHTVNNDNKKSIEANNNNSKNKKIKVGSREMTEEQYKEYLEFQKMFPDIDWGADAMFTGYETQTASNVPTPLRVR